MVDIPIYTSKVQAPGGVTNTVQPLRPSEAPGAPSFEGLGSASRAMGQFGDALAELGGKLQVAQAHTTAAVQTTEYLKRLDEIETQHQRDPDFQNAPQNFQRAHGELVRELSEKISDGAIRERSVLEWTRSGFAAGRRVRETAWTREVDVNLGAINAQEAEGVRLAAAAPAASVERLAATDGYFKSVDAATDAGWLNETERVKRKARFNQTLDISDVQAVIRDDPERAVKLLADPKMFSNIDPIQRGQWINTARHAADARGQLDLVAAAGFNPAGALATTGRLTDPGQARVIFDQGIIPAEGGEKDGAALVSPKGAIGVAQILPGTAREQATKLGLADVAALSDDDLVKRLKDDRPLNYRLGLNYWNELGRRYSGNIPVMAAAYNAGPARADEWTAAAVAKFGPDFTAAQFMEVVNFKETRGYLERIYTKLGAEPSGGSLSPQGRAQAALKIAARIHADEAERVRGIKDLATSDRLTNDPLTLMQAGFNPEPTALALTVTRSLEAARNGDVTAAKYLRDLAEQRRIEPMVRGAYATAPVELDQAVARMESELAAAPSVTLQQKNSLDALRAVRDEVRKRKDSDPVTLGARAGLYAPVAIDPKGGADDPAWRNLLSVRGQQAIVAQRLYQGSAAPFMPQEAAALKERYSAAGETERHGIVLAFADTMPARVRDAALEQIGAGAAERIAANFSARPEIARAILHGSTLLNDKDFDKKTSVVREAMRVKLGGEVYPSPAMQHDVETAALAVYANDRGAQALYDPADGAAIERAIEKVTGTIVKRNGRRVPVAPGLSVAEFEGALDNLDQRSLLAAGGAFDRNGQPFDPGEISRRAQLVPRAPGSDLYMVLMPTPDGRGAPVMTFDAGPLVLNMRDVARRHRDNRVAADIGQTRALIDLQQAGPMVP